MLVQYYGQRTFCAEEFARYIQSFAADDHNLLAIKQLLGHRASQATQEMSFTVNYDLHR